MHTLTTSSHTAAGGRRRPQSAHAAVSRTTSDKTKKLTHLRDSKREGGEGDKVQERPFSATKVVYDRNGRRTVIHIERPPSAWMTFKAFNAIYHYSDSPPPSKLPNVEVFHPLNKKEFTNEDLNALRSLTSTAQQIRERLIDKTAQMDFSADQIPDWVMLRDRYIQQLEDLSEKIWAREPQECGRDHEKRDFIMLMSALRKVTKSILRYYLKEVHAYKDYPHVLESHPAWQEFMDYCYSIPMSLDWLDEEPFRSWSGLHCSLNPLLALNNIASDLAINVGNNLHLIVQAMFPQGVSSQPESTIDDDEEVEEEEEDEGVKYSKLLIDLMPKELQYSEEEDGELRKFGKLLMKWYENYEHYQQSRGSNLTNSNSNRRRASLALIAPRNNKRVDTRKLLAMREEEVKRRRMHFAQFVHFKKWKRRLYIFRGVKRMIRKRRRRIKSKVIQGFITNVIKERRIVKLHQRYLEDLLHKVVDGWKGVVLWCRRFRTLQKRCIREQKRHYLMLWQEYIKTQTVLKVSPQKVRFTEDDVIPIEQISCALHDILNTTTEAYGKVEDGISYSSRVVRNALDQTIPIESTAALFSPSRYQTLTASSLFHKSNNTSKMDQILDSLKRTYETKPNPKRGLAKILWDTRNTFMTYSQQMTKAVGVGRIYPSLQYQIEVPKTEEQEKSVENCSLAHEV